MSNLSDQKQIGGGHYKDMEIQPWSAMKAWMTQEQFIGYLRGNVIKYMARADKKGLVEDYKKALHYLEKLTEELEAVPTYTREPIHE